ncbi:hypothetical protein FRX31_014706, partial [Thalictrum thalictroides]
MAEKKMINIRLLVDKEKNKVVFAESDKDFVEILFSFLTLPIGTVVRLANKETNLGCIDALYKSVEALDMQYLQTEACKKMLLGPRSEAEPKNKSLALNYLGSADLLDYYICPKWTCASGTHCLYSMFESATCLCGQKMNRRFVLGKNITDDNRLNGTYIVNGSGKFMISDDLEVTRLSTDTTFQILSRFGIKDGSALEEIKVSVGTVE